ncbi:putative ankyrin repeat-containing protein-like isoform 2 [Capsicum annuum]|nr:putative ankyrin repeat-containing protein-like isoform 2 [Capsicum annuum]
MDPTLYNAAMRGNIGDANFLLADHLKRDEENGYQVTPKGNTVLHVAALYGHSHFVEEVLKITPALFCCQNKKNETALHIAANEGHTEVVRVLLACVEDHNTKEKLTRMMDASGDTALHKAVRSQHLDVVKLLVTEDPEFEFPPNHAQETPLYLAAESGFHDALIKILESFKKPTYVAGPSNRTPLHAAAIQEHKDCIRSLWRWNKPLCEEPDLWGWNSLHYAVKLGLTDVVSDMLEWKKSLVYLPAGSENDWTTAIHIAASQGYVYMIYKLLNQCPDCWDMLNSNNQNALHVAVLNNQDNVVRFLLDSDKCSSLVDEPDSDGNTPLHLLAASDNHVPELINHPRAKNMSFNKQNQTPLDIALSCKATTKKEKLVEDLFSNGLFGKRDFEVKRKYKSMSNPNDQTGIGVAMQLRKDDQDKAENADQTVIESIMKVAQIHIVVATLIMTVTFAAGITLPGGFESNSDSPNQGMAILIRKTSFRAFVVSNAIAFTFSAVAIFIYFLMAAQSRIPQRKKIVWKFYNLAAIFQCLSMLAVVIAFATDGHPWKFLNLQRREGEDQKFRVEKKKEKREKRARGRRGNTRLSFVFSLSTSRYITTSGDVA